MCLLSNPSSFGSHQFFGRENGYIDRSPSPHIPDDALPDEPSRPFTVAGVHGHAIDLLSSGEIHDPEGHRPGYNYLKTAPTGASTLLVDDSLEINHRFGPFSLLFGVCARVGAIDEAVSEVRDMVNEPVLGVP